MAWTKSRIKPEEERLGWGSTNQSIHVLVITVTISTTTATWLVSAGIRWHSLAEEDERVHVPWHAHVRRREIERRGELGSADRERGRGERRFATKAVISVTRQ